MSASKLGNYEDAMNAAKDCLRQAIAEQGQSKDSFSVIKEQYRQCKTQYDVLVNMQAQQSRMAQWKLAAKWMRYHDEQHKVAPMQEHADTLQRKVARGDEVYKSKTAEYREKLDDLKQFKDEMMTTADDCDQYLEPMNRAKQALSKLDKARKECALNASSKERLITSHKRKIRSLQQQYAELSEQSQNNERARKLADLKAKLDSARGTLEKLRPKREELLPKCEESIEQKDNAQKLSAKKSEIYHKEEELQRVQGQLRALNSSNSRSNRSDKFLDRACAHKRITVRMIHTELQRYRRKFSRLPVGPLGEYILMNETDNAEVDAQNIQIVQSVLQNSLGSFLVANKSDLNLFRDIIRRKWGITINCMCFRPSDRMYAVSANVFEHFQFEHSMPQQIARVSDMFHVKDDSAWIYNALITNSAPERVFAYGDSNSGNKLLSSFSSGSSHLRAIAYLVTYDLYKLTRRGGSVAGQNMGGGREPLLQTDKSRMKVWFQQQITAKAEEVTQMKSSVDHLERFVHNEKQRVKAFQREFAKVSAALKTCEGKIARWSNAKTQIEEEEEDNDELAQSMTDIDNQMSELRAEIGDVTEEIEPFKAKEREILTECSVKKRELAAIAQQIKDAQFAAEQKDREYQRRGGVCKQMMAKLKVLPQKIDRMKGQLAAAQSKLSEEKTRIEAILTEAKSAGDEVAPEMYPRDDTRNGHRFGLPALTQRIRKDQAEIDAYNAADHDAEDITNRYEAIKPKYETHQQKVDACNRNCDEMHRQLVHRKKSYTQMKEQVKRQLNIEFRMIMRSQGHEGKLNVNYEDEELEMCVHMQSHDGTKQVRNTKTLSGGERSFTQVALIMALQKFSGSPMCIYDEFDVFMDSVNRGNSLKVLLDAALSSVSATGSGGAGRQYLFITPNDVSPIIAQGHDKHKISIHRLNPPRK